MLVKRLPRFEGFALAVFRVAMAVLFMQHGAQKLFGAFGGLNGGTAPLASRLGAAGVIEFFGGLLIGLGLLTRPVALVCAFEMLAAYFLVHLPRSAFPIARGGGELALVYLFTFFYLAARGPGQASMDWVLFGDRGAGPDRFVRTPEEEAREGFG